MVAGRSIPGWAAGVAVMAAYISSISYIATPGKAFETNWHPVLFALAMIPVAWFICKYAVPYYRKAQLISVYEFLEVRLGQWGRVYAALSFVLYMIGRSAVIFYLAGLLLNTIAPWNIVVFIILMGAITVFYSLLGGMEAVIWTDVFQSIIMLAGIIFCAVLLSIKVFAGPDFLLQSAFDANKFSFGSLNLELSSRTVWVMIIYGITENFRNLLADQNYVQKYASVPDERQAKRSIWYATWMYIGFTALFLYTGTALYAFYSNSTELADHNILKGDQVFPYYIATQLPVGVKGLVVAAILASAMSTVSSALNCSATVMLLDFHKRYFNTRMTEKASMNYLRWITVVWGILGTGFAILMIKAASALDTWWAISGIFGGGILGLFLLALMKIRLRLWQGLVSIGFSIAVITWGVFARNLSVEWRWLQCDFDTIITGAIGTIGMLLVGVLFGLTNRNLCSVRTDAEKKVL